MNGQRSPAGLAAALAVLVVAALVAAPPARAETARFLEGLDTATVRALMLLTRENLAQAQMPDGEAVPEATPEDASPVIPVPDGRLVVDAGIASDIAEWCGVEWSAGNFLPLMTWQRGRGRWDDRQIAYIGLLHGVAMGLTRTQAAASGDCPEETRARVGDWIDGRWSGGGD